MFAQPVGYGSDRFENGTELQRERAELAVYSRGPGEDICSRCWSVHRKGACIYD